MTINIRPRYGWSRVSGGTLDLLEDEEIRIMKITALQCSVIRQMCFPWVYYYERLVDEHVDYWEIVEQPTAYKEALEALELMVGGGYVPPEEIQMGDQFVDRGAAVAFDFTIGSGLTADSAWHDLNLSGLIADSDATLVLLYCYVKDGSAGLLLNLRKELDPNNTKNCAPCQTEVANQYLYHHPIVALASRKIQYLISSGMDDCGIFVRGWWKPTYGYGA